MLTEEMDVAVLNERAAINFVWIIKCFILSYTCIYILLFKSKKKIRDQNKKFKRPQYIYVFIFF